MIKPEDYLIEDIINSGQVAVLFQPLVFIKKKRIAGYSSFCRSDIAGKDPVDARELFRSAERFGLVLQLDRLFRKKSLESFLYFYWKDKETILSINVNSSAIKSGFGSKNLFKTVQKSGIDPSNIIIELAESDFEEDVVLAEFAAEYRKLGFMISIVRSGSGFSKRDRISASISDLVILDRSIIGGVDSDFFRQEVSHSLINLAHKSGALVIADGIETCDDALMMMELGADILQGNYFSEPRRAEDIHTGDIERKIFELSELYRTRMIERMSSRNESRKRYTMLIDRIISDILGSGQPHPVDAIKETVNRYSMVECIYILDDSGIQITDTFMNMQHRRQNVNGIFHPGGISSDQSNKEYYLSLLPDLESYMSGPYISAATGNVCLTFSKRYMTEKGEGRILCVDFSMME